MIRLNRILVQNERNTPFLRLGIEEGIEAPSLRFQVNTEKCDMLTNLRGKMLSEMTLVFRSCLTIVSDLFDKASPQTVSYRDPHY